MYTCFYLKFTVSEMIFLNKSVWKIKMSFKGGKYPWLIRFSSALNANHSLLCLLLNEFSQMSRSINMKIKLAISFISSVLINGKMLWAKLG